jgi:hypothetical protein
MQNLSVTLLREAQERLGYIACKRKHTLFPLAKGRNRARREQLVILDGACKAF